MKKTDLIIVGAGNPDIIKLVEDINDRNNIYNLIGFLEKDESLHGTRFSGHEVIGGDDLLFTEFKHCAVVNNVSASTKIRFEISGKLLNTYGMRDFPNLIHPSVSTKYLKYGTGNIIYDNVSLGADVEIGDFNLIFYCTVIAHQTKIGSYNLFGGNVMVGSRAIIGDRVTVSNSCTISNKLTIGNDVFIGVGSVVVGSIHIPKRVFGNPAREMIIK